MLAIVLAIPFLLAATARPFERQAKPQYHIVSGRDAKCLATSTVEVGAAVISVDCNDPTAYSFWEIEHGSGSVLLYNTQLALDAGETPGNGGSLKVWTSSPGLYQQTWYYTDDNRIAITGGDQCLDEGDNGVQTWQCGAGNGNQVWTAEMYGGGPSTTIVSSTTVADPTTV